MRFCNIENHKAYDFVLDDKHHHRGISAMLRVKNEERTIRASIISIIDFVDEVLVVDNGSTDKTPDIIDELVFSYPDKILSRTYPFRVSLCGLEFANTPADSIHSLAYYYNWCKSGCKFSYLIKWDADMIIPEHKRTRWKAIRDRVLNANDLVYQPIGRLVVLDESRKFRDSGLNFLDPRIYPNNNDYYFVKADNCFTERIGYRGEVFTFCRKKLNMVYSEEVDYFEVKDLNKNEFDHFGKGEAKLEEKQSREENLLGEMRKNTSKYQCIAGERFLELVDLQ